MRRVTAGSGPSSRARSSAPTCAATGTSTRRSTATPERSASGERLETRPSGRRPQGRPPPALLNVGNLIEDRVEGAVRKVRGAELEPGVNGTVELEDSRGGAGAVRPIGLDGCPQPAHRVAKP